MALATFVAGQYFLVKAKNLYHHDLLTLKNNEQTKTGYKRFLASKNKLILYIKMEVTEVTHCMVTNTSNQEHECSTVLLCFELIQDFKTIRSIKITEDLSIMEKLSCTNERESK